MHCDRGLSGARRWASDDCAVAPRTFLAEAIGYTQTCILSLAGMESEFKSPKT